jgi:transcriptional regulator with XRE-family HTH domain
MPKYDAMKEFSANLAEAMQQGGWNQSSLAKASGLKQPDISDILSGKNDNPKVNTMERIAEAVGLPLYQLMMPVRRAEKVSA